MATAQQLIAALQKAPEAQEVGVDIGGEIYTIRSLEIKNVLASFDDSEEETSNLLIVCDVEDE